jgi:acyl-CoA reductase-like NAD-dependent aldehyde dehydrogenase
MAVLLMREAGKPIRDARSEVDRCVATLRHSAAVALTMSGEMVPTSSPADGLALALRVPAGVVAAITPFNFPLNLVAHKVGPAIAAGCPVVLKPSEDAPLSALALVDVLYEAGLPPGWITPVTGTGEAVGAPLVAHPVPRVVSFTGSVSAGRSIAARASDKRVLLELGSNAPVIVHGDGDVARAATDIARAGFSYAGQSCISTQRVFVDHAVYREFVELLRRSVDALVVGDPADERTDVGPMIRPAERDRVVSWVDEAVRGGGTVAAGGGVTDGLLQPTVVLDPPMDCALMTKEAFGPVVGVVPYAGFDEALRMANATDFGLQAGVYTTSTSLALRAAAELDFGGVLINRTPTFRMDQQPYGGRKDAGNTREGPAYAALEMTDLKFVLLND